MAGRKRAARADGDRIEPASRKLPGSHLHDLVMQGPQNKAIYEAAGTDLAAINYHFGPRRVVSLCVFEGYERFD